MQKSMYFFERERDFFDLSSGRKMSTSMHFCVLSSGRPFIQTVRLLGISSTTGSSGTAPVDLSEVDAGVEAGLGLLVQGVLHRARLELLLRTERLLLVEHLAELTEIHPAVCLVSITSLL